MAKQPAKHTLHIISHTHWDREWYLTYQQFRRRLVDLIDRLVNLLEGDPRFRTFHLDAQTIVLEDYLQIRPEMRPRLEALITAGRILVGPWYQLNDENLVSGESTVRSLLIGSRIANAFGACTRIGYLPDQFGNVSQMPQIFRQFGIDSCIFGRGHQPSPEESAEFMWESPDGSRVLTVLMRHWYNNAQRLPNDRAEATKYLQAIEGPLGPLCASRHLLLMNGVDHLEAQYDLGEILEGVAGLGGDDRPDVRHSTMPDFVRDLRADLAGTALRTVRGELRDDNGGAVLAGTLSTRVYLKQANHACEVALERAAEPLSAMALMAGGPYDADFLRYAWKLLMQNHPHDSICGCSIDQVHREMMPRFEQVLQVAGEVIHMSTDALLATVDTSFCTGRDQALALFNTLPTARTLTVEADVDFPLGPARREGGHSSVDIAARGDIDSVTLENAQGETLPCSIVATSLENVRVIDPVELPKAQNVRRFRVRFVAPDVPAMGYTVIRVRPVTSLRRPEVLGYAAPTEPGEAAALENEYLRVAVAADGTLSIADKSTRSVYRGLGLFVDGGDHGDEYVHLTPVSDRLFTSAAALRSVTMEHAGPDGATCRLDMAMRVSAGRDGEGRAGNLVDLSISTWLTLSSASRRLEVRTEVTNPAKDHRLRVHFPTDTKAETSHAATAFGVETRSLELPQSWYRPATARSQREFCACVDPITGRGLAIANRGLAEYELLPDARRTLALTLLRSVGCISAGSDAPGDSSTPEAQCIGTTVTEYAIIPFGGQGLGPVYQEALDYCTPAVARQAPAGNCGAHPPTMSFIRLSSPGGTAMEPDCVFSALKRAEDDGDLILRFFSIGDMEKRVVVTSDHCTATAQLSDADEGHGEFLAAGTPGGEFELAMRPRGIHTLRLSLRR